MNSVCIIPARGGSKGIPKKNIIPIAGKPLVAWSIEQAVRAQSIRRVYVSTDDDQIAVVAKSFGAEIIDRPDSLSKDDSTSESALLHAWDTIEKIDNDKYDSIVFLQATSPLREEGDLDAAIKLYADGKFDTLLSCTKLEDYFIWQKDSDNFVSVNYDFHNRKRRQDITPHYLENGSIYIFTPEVLIKYNNRLAGKIGVYEMAFWKSYQIDNEEDIEICEYYLNTRVLHKQVRYEP